MSAILAPFRWVGHGLGAVFGSMSYRQKLAMAALTTLYLCCELAFNARLLDVVGGPADPQQVHHIEVFGRSLSGIAVALVVLQAMLGRRNLSATGRPGAKAIGAWCLAFGVAVYMALQLLVNYLVATSTPEMRRTSQSIVLVQRALVAGQVQLDGLDDDPGLFARPEGKAFLALFPAMAMSVDRLDEKLHDSKMELLKRTVSGRLGGPQGLCQQYEKALAQLQLQWQRYRRAPGPVDLDAEIVRRQDQAWNDYLNDLGKRGWTPSTVPGMARAAVLRKVRARVPIPADWNLVDEAGFRNAVADQVRRKAGKAESQMRAGGRPIPPGLGWEAFLAQPGVQAEMRHRLGLPDGVVLRAGYATEADFERTVFAPLVNEAVKREWAAYEAPVSAFMPGGTYYSQGEDAARAVIVPPVALFFSLLGAIGHMTKLSYLLLRLVVDAIPAWRGMRRLWMASVALSVGCLGILSWTDNAVTQSRLYVYMRAQMEQSTPPSLGTRMQTKALMTALHWVAVGQGVGYPADEWIRKNVLHDFDFGYEPPSR